ncbi:unnamed protein product [Urochloa humidicola]
MSESDDEPGTCYRWSRNFVVAHAILATGFITAPVAVLHLLRRPHTGAATFFAMFSFFCAAISAVLCCRFYAPAMAALAFGGDGVRCPCPAAGRRWR